MPLTQLDRFAFVFNGEKDGIPYSRVSVYSGSRDSRLEANQTLANHAKQVVVIPVKSAIGTA